MRSAAASSDVSCSKCAISGRTVSRPPSGAFAAALAAEGAPLYLERFSGQDGSERLLHQMRLFNEFDGSTWGGCIGDLGEANRRNLEIAIDVACKQNMIPRKFTVEELFE